MANIKTDRDNIVLNAAIRCAEEDGWHYITRAKTARLADVAVGTVNNAYGDVTALKDAVMQAAIDRRLLPILAEGLAFGNPVAKSAPEELRLEAAMHLASGA
jgi:AcrR family transcriptional regulator